MTRSGALGENTERLQVLLLGGGGEDIIPSRRSFPALVDSGGGSGGLGQSGPQNGYTLPVRRDSIHLDAGSVLVLALRILRS